MSWLTYADPTAFDTAAAPFLHSRPVHHTVLLTIAERARRHGASSVSGRPAEFGLWTAPDGTVSAAFVRTPPHGPLLTELPPGAAEELAALYAASEPAMGGATGPLESVTAFAAAWRAATGVGVNSTHLTRLYRLGDLNSPAPRPGQDGLTAAPGDRALLTAWWGEFGEAIGSPVKDPGGQVSERLAFGGVSLWRDAGRPVAMAARSRTVAGMTRVAPVYTPRALRCRGYAGAATALVCRAAREDGARHVVLFTDLANQVTNALYPRLGFRAVADHARVEFAR